MSDGLLRDLGHVCRASGVAAEVELARVPVAPRCRRVLGARAARFAVTAGEAYELVVVLPQRAATVVERGRFGCAVTRIGRIVSGRPAVRLIDARGRPLAAGAGGFDHFR